MNFRIQIFLVILILLGLLSCNFEVKNKTLESFVDKDSLLFSDSSKVPNYPYKKQYAAFLTKQQFEIDSIKNLVDIDTNLIIDNFSPTPTIFIVENENDTLSLEQYSQKFIANDSIKSSLIFKIKIEWNGKISEVYLDKIKGEIPLNINLKNMCKKLRVIPAKVDNIPMPNQNIYTFMLNFSNK